MKARIIDAETHDEDFGFAGENDAYVTVYGVLVSIKYPHPRRSLFSVQGACLRLLLTSRCCLTRLNHHLLFLIPRLLSISNHTGPPLHKELQTWVVAGGEISVGEDSNGQQRQHTNVEL